MDIRGQLGDGRGDAEQLSDQISRQKDHRRFWQACGRRGWSRRAG